jgi:hypothetical protein
MQCPKCHSNDTVAVYFHKCPNLDPPQKFISWCVFPSPPQNPATGKPEPRPCPDGLNLPNACGGDVEARALYCYNCLPEQALTVFPPS